MTKTDNGKKYALIAAICYAIYAIYSIINRIIYVKSSDYATITALNIIFWVILIGFVVTLFIKNKLAVLIVSGIYALLFVYYLVQYFSLYNLLWLLSIAAIVVTLVLSLKNHQITKKIWFIGAALLFVGTLIMWIQHGYFEYFSFVWKDMLSCLVEISGFLFIGLWAKGITTTCKAAPVNEYATFNPQAYSSTASSNDIIGGADKLKMYKELLDSGAITQEEFDAKKKQIIGL